MTACQRRVGNPHKCAAADVHGEHFYSCAVFNMHITNTFVYLMKTEFGNYPYLSARLILRGVS